MSRIFRTRARRPVTRVRCLTPTVAAVIVSGPETTGDDVKPTHAEKPTGAAAKLAVPDGEAKESWRSLFDGKTLGDWKSTEFGGEGDVRVENGNIECDFGQYLTGVTYTGKDLPTSNYEIELEASRQDGFDFFCGLTFPVDDSHVTFVVGGWGGSVVGISSIDDMDASENDTTAYVVFKKEQWYKIRVRVTADRIQAWIDDKVIVDKDVKGSRLSTRIEVDRSKPLGLASFDTHAAYRHIRIRAVTEPAAE